MLVIEVEDIGTGKFNASLCRWGNNLIFLPGVTWLAVPGIGVYCFSFQYLSNISKRWKGFPGGSDSKESACNVGDLGSNPGLGRSPGGGHGNPLQYSCLENPCWQRSLAGCNPWGHKQSDTTDRLSTHMNKVKVMIIWTFKASNWKWKSHRP